MAPNSDKKITGPRDLFLILLHGWVVVAIFVAIMLLAAIAELHLEPPLYYAQMVATPVSSTTDTSSAASRLGSLSGLASLAGVSIPSGQNPNQFRLYVELLRSRNVADDLANNQKLMRTIYGYEWDDQSHAWREPPEGVLDRIKNGLKDLLGFPPEPWQPPDGLRLQKFLSYAVQVQEDPRKPYLATIGFSSYDPKFAVEFLNLLNQAADSRLRKVALLQADNYIDYLSKKLDTVTAAEYREAIMVTLADQEKYAMSASSGTPFAAQLLDRPSAAAEPISPDPRQSFIKAIAFGLFLGALVVWGWHVFGYAVRRWLRSSGTGRKLPKFVRNSLQL